MLCLGVAHIYTSEITSMPLLLPTTVYPIIDFIFLFSFFNFLAVCDNVAPEPVASSIRRTFPYSR
jgi:hypothetical protein